MDLDFYKTTISKQQKLGLFFLHSMNLCCHLFTVTEFLRFVIICVRLTAKVKSLSPERSCRHLSPNTKKAVLWQNKLVYSSKSYVLDDHFAALKTTLDKLFTEIIIMLTQIRV